MNALTPMDIFTTNYNRGVGFIVIAILTDREMQLEVTDALSAEFQNKDADSLLARTSACGPDDSECIGRVLLLARAGEFGEGEADALSLALDHVATLHAEREVRQEFPGWKYQ